MKSLNEVRIEVCDFSPLKQAKRNTLMDKIPMKEVTGFVDRLYLNDKLIATAMYEHKEKMGTAEQMNNGIQCQILWNKLNTLIHNESPRGILAIKYPNGNIVSGYVVGFLDGANIFIRPGFDDEVVLKNCEINYEEQIIISEEVKYDFAFYSEEDLKEKLCK